MKRTKGIMALVLALLMVLGMSSMSVFAATIEVQNVIDGETYTAYKILNYTNSGNAYSYYLSAEEYGSLGSVLEDAGFAFTESADGTIYTLNNAENVDVAAAAEYLHNHVTDLGNALGKYQTIAENGKADFGELATGYYFVTTTAGSLCALHSENGIETVVEKNTVPTVDKKEKTSGDSFTDGPVDANMGDTVHYQIVVTDGVGTDKAITLTDTMSAGLDYTAGSLKINSTAVADDADTDDWKVTVSGRTITIVLKAAYVKTLNTNDTVTITYDATINKNAVVDSATGNENKVELNYSKQHSEDEVYVETYDFLVKKTDGTNFLDGAEFKLYDAAKDGNQIILSKDDTGYYKDADGSAATTIDINSADGCNVRGLAPGTYYLEEVVVPDGYNKLSERKAITITSGATEAAEITIENQAGAVLPSTGGIGTVIFYVIGAALVIGCGVVLISRRRVSGK